VELNLHLYMHLNHLIYDLSQGTKIKVIWNGRKAMYAKFGSNTMIDSLNHLKTSLAALPKTVRLS
jgi:hypothetical protein